jgi:hypothetical protein
MHKIIPQIDLCKRGWPNNSPKSFEEYKNQKYYYRYLANKFFFYLRPKHCPVQIINNNVTDRENQKRLCGRGEPLNLCSWGFVKDNFHINIENKIPNDLYDSVQVELTISESMTIRQHKKDGLWQTGTQQITQSLTLRTKLQEQEILDNCHYLYHKIIGIIEEKKRLYSIVANKEYITRREINGLLETKIDRSQPDNYRYTENLESFYYLIYIFQYHTFIDKFLNRMYNKHINGDHNSFNDLLKRLLGDDTRSISSKVNLLNKYKLIRDDFVHGIYRKMMNIKTEDIDVDKIKSTYEDVARCIWKKYEGTVFPTFIKRLNPSYNSYEHGFLTNQETRVLVKQYAKMGQSRRDELRKIIDEVEAEMIENHG